jgi:hypothetical protein
MNHTTILSVARETDRYIEITGAQLPTGRFNLRYDLIDMAKLTSERSKSTAVTSNAGSSVHLGRRNDIAFDEAIVAAEQLADAHEADCIFYRCPELWHTAKIGLGV